MEKAVSHKCVTGSGVIKVLPGHPCSQSSFLFPLFFCGSTDPPSLQQADYFGSNANLCDKKIIWQLLSDYIGPRGPSAGELRKRVGVE